MKVFNKSNILIPKDMDLGKWSVIACDQHTSNPQYWEKVKEIVGESNSTYNIIVPEAYLNTNKDKLIKKANLNMNEYVEKQIFQEYPNSLVYVERCLSNGKIRQGIVGQIDLEYYSEKITESTKIKPSEAIVEERIPTRIDVRKNAILDLPHAVLFCADEQKSIIETLKSKVGEVDKVYDFNLMMNGGNIKGYLLNDNLAKNVVEEINKNIEESGFIVADGNHSLVAAKRVYEQSKKHNDDYLNSPLRYALVEVVNIYNDAVEIDPIYRILSNVNRDDIIKLMDQKFSTQKSENTKLVEVISKDYRRIYYIESNKDVLEIQLLQEFLDEYLKECVGEIDYIHELSKLEELCENESSIGFKFEPISKDMIVSYTKDKLFPRKTFSIGASSDKRYYLECRKLIK